MPEFYLSIFKVLKGLDFCKKSLTVLDIPTAQFCNKEHSNNVNKNLNLTFLCMQKIKAIILPLLKSQKTSLSLRVALLLFVILTCAH